MTPLTNYINHAIDVTPRETQLYYTHKNTIIKGDFCDGPDPYSHTYRKWEKYGFKILGL